MRLLLVELTRLRWRRAVIVLTALAVVLPVLIWAGMAWDTRPLTDAERRQGTEMMEDEQRYQQEALQDCVQNPEAHFGPDGPPDGVELEQACEEMMFGGFESTPEMYFGRDPLTIATAGDTATGVMVLLLVIVLLVGATFAGADWSSGSLSNQLLFEPRRVRLWTAKAGAVMIGGLVLAVVGIATFWALTWGLASIRDVSGSAEEWRSVAKDTARGVGLAIAAALAGFVVTMFLRSTVGTLGTLLAVAIGGSLLIASLPVDGVQRWFLPHNVLGILQGGFPYWDSTAPECVTSMDGETGCQQVLSVGEGVRFLGTLLLVGVGLSLASFRRRDVP